MRCWLAAALAALWLGWPPSSSQAQPGNAGAPGPSVAAIQDGAVGGGQAPALAALADDDSLRIETTPAMPGVLGDASPDEKQTATETAAAPKRRALPSPWDSPPFPSAEYQGYPLIGVPVDTTRWPLMRAIQGTPACDLLDAERIRIYGWINVSGNLSNCANSNMPASYWIVPNSVQMDQTVLRVERQVDTVQTDHVDWGFRSTLLYGTDYRYMTAGGWFSDQLLNHNLLYGWDPTEQYVDVYVPNVADGLVVRVGRWIACPDIETQFAPDNYLGSHSILFTFDTYTQTGVMGTVMLNEQWTLQACIESGTDMAPWYKGAIATGMFGVRWVSEDNNDSVYTCLNNINDAKFRHFEVDGQPAGHDNFNYLVSTWQHRFNKYVFTKTEAYFMWQFDAVMGGTPSLGPVRSFGGGGGIGAPIPGASLDYGVVNYTMFQLTQRSFLTVRNEWWNDQEGERSGYATPYTDNTIGVTFFANPDLMIRPEIGYYRSWDTPAFNNGTRQNMVLAGCDVTLRF